MGNSDVSYGGIPLLQTSHKMLSKTDLLMFTSYTDEIVVHIGVDFNIVEELTSYKMLCIRLEKILVQWGITSAIYLI
jgi:hypothetical protein